MPSIADVFVTVLPETSKIKDGVQRAFREADPVAAEAGRRWGGEIRRGIGKTKVDLKADTAKARAEINDAAKDRKTTIHVDVDRNQLERLNQLISQGATKQASALSSLMRAQRTLAQGGFEDAFAYSQAVLQVQKAGQDFAASATQVSGSLSHVSMMGIAAPAAIAGVGAALVELGGIAAVTAQSLWLLPAAIGGVVAGVGTLQLATMGFSDALKSIRDPEKFATALQGLAPNAQQAALSIQALLPAFDQLKNATQNAFFAGIGPQLNALATQYLPAIQQMTTGIAGAFNQMFSGIANQLMRPETQQAMQTFMSNVTSAFKALAPALAPLTKAFAQIMSVGSGFLPGLAQSAAQLAQKFSDFIDKASQSGDLQRWLSEGLDALRQMWPIVVGLAQAFMSLAPVGQAILPQISSMLSQINTIMPVIKAVALTIGPSFGVWQVALNQVHGVVNLVSGAFDRIKGVVAGVGVAVQAMANTVLAALNRMLQPLRDAINLANQIPGVNLPNLPTLSVGAPAAPTVAGTPVPAAGQDNTTFNRTSRPGAAAPTSPIAPVPSGGYAVPAPPPAKLPTVSIPAVAPAAAPAASIPGFMVTPQGVQNAIALAQGASGQKYGYGGTGDPGHQGLYDCSGFMSSLFAAMTGQTTTARFFTTESDFTKLGFKPTNVPVPGTFQIGIHQGGGGPNSHMAGTLPNNVNVESGGHGTLYGGMAAGAWDKQFEKHYYLPGSGTPSAMATPTNTPSNPTYVAYAPEQYQQYKPGQDKAGELGSTVGGDLMDLILPDGFKNPFQTGGWKFVSGLLNGLMGIKLPQGSAQGGDGASLMGGGGGGGLGGLLGGLTGIIPKPFGPLGSGSPGDAPGSFMPLMPNPADAQISPFQVTGTPGTAGPGNQVNNNQLVINNPVGQDHLTNMVNTAQQAQVPRVRQGVRPLP